MLLLKLTDLWKSHSISMCIIYRLVLCSHAMPTCKIANSYGLKCIYKSCLTDLTCAELNVSPLAPKAQKESRANRLGETQAMWRKGLSSRIRRGRSCSSGLAVWGQGAWRGGCLTNLEAVWYDCSLLEATGAEAEVMAIQWTRTASNELTSGLGWAVPWTTHTDIHT